METINKEILNRNDFYINTIKYIFFSPEIFLTNSYISEIIIKMESKLLDDDLSIQEFINVKFILGLCIYKSNDYFSAIKIFESLADSDEVECNPLVIGYLNTILSILYLKTKNIDNHIKYFNVAITYLKSKNLNELLLYLYLNTSLTKLEVYNTDELLYSNINNSFKLLNEYEGIYSSQAFITLGTIYNKYLNLHSIAIDLFNKSLSISKSNNEIYMDILVKYNIANTYLTMGQLRHGIDILKCILKNNNNTLPSIFKINIYSKILASLFKIDDIFDDVEMFLTLYKDELYNLDSYYIDIYLAQYNLIIVHYKILQNNNSYNDKVQSDLFYYLDNASYIYKSNFSKFTFMDFEYWLEISYGNLYFALCDYEKALMHHKKALLFSEKPKNENTINLYKLISQDYEKLENYKDSLKYYKTSVDAIENNNKYNNDLYIKLFDEFNRNFSLNSVNNNFFSNLSHELKTPVNIIYSSVQLMGALKDKDTYSLKESFIKYEKSVKQNCLRMLRLINNLIDITKIDSGMTKLDLVLIDIVPFIEDLTLSLIPYTKFKNLNITFDTNVEKLYLKIDSYAFERILLNLLSNAIKFSNMDGNILVSISSSKNNVSISIKDTGIGIPNDLKDSIFKRFYKVDNSLSRNTEGSGIGLAITKDLVHLHGGTITLNQNYKDGSEFIITFPTIPQKGITTENDYKHFIDDEKILSELSDIYELF